MLSPEALSNLAVKHTQAHAQRALSGDMLVTAAPPNRAWDEYLLRTVHHQALTIWRKYGRFDIIIDGSHKLVGFVDYDKYEGPGDQELGQDEALALIRKAGVVPEDARLESYASIPPPSGSGRLWKAVFGLAAAESEYTLLEVEINAVKGAVVSVRPKRRGGSK
jgi:hypothetical protein